MIFMESEAHKIWRKLNYDKIKEQNRKAEARWREIHPDRAKEVYMRYYNKDHRYTLNYGVTFNFVKELYLNQEHKCAICGEVKELNKLQLDHNHITGKIRGLLCFRCNSKLAHVENREFLEKSLLYLGKYR
jgi:hypothetical protein